jgi:hypothetical protein
MIQRFMTHVQVQPNGCWLWDGHLSAQGYGQFWMEGKSVAAHRASLMLFKGIDMAGQLARHDCDNPPCVNPDHLRPGTHQDNKNDAVERLRHGYGENNGRAKLTREQVVAIRQDTRDKWILAEIYGVSAETIYSIRCGRTWKTL